MSFETELSADCYIFPCSVFTSWKNHSALMNGSNETDCKISGQKIE